jgi:hypothetical protein
MLVGNPEEKRIWKIRHTWENNIKMDLKYYASE